MLRETKSSSDAGLRTGPFVMAPHVTDRTGMLSPAISPESRLSMDPALARRGILDGGWWPLSRDASVELPKLISSLNQCFGAVLRLGVDARDWDEIPRRITVGGHPIRVGRFADVNHKIIVTRGPQDHILLLVVPPRASTASAKSALAMASAGKNSGMPEEILAASGADGAGANPSQEPPGVGEQDRGLRSADARKNEPREIDRWLDDGAPSQGSP